MRFKQVFIIGAGYVGRKLGAKLIESGVTVRAMVRSEDAAARPRASRSAYSRAGGRHHCRARGPG